MTAPVAAAELARRIVEEELDGRELPDEVAERVEAAFARLRALVSLLIGEVGFGALMARALHLTRPSCRFFETAEVRADGTLRIEGLSRAVEVEGAPAIAACAASLLACALELLCSFIGRDLTVRLVRRGWDVLTEEPDAAADPEDQGT